MNSPETLEKKPAAEENQEQIEHDIRDDVLVVKVGTSTIVNKSPDGSEHFDKESFDNIGWQLNSLQEEGAKVVLVTSGGITGGMVEVNAKSRPTRESDMVELQRLSAIGWMALLHEWENGLRRHRPLGPLQLTRHELDHDAHERGEALRVINRMFDHGDLPVVNENDAVSHDEIMFGDNDILAAMLAARMSTSPEFDKKIGLILLTNVDGVYADKYDRGSRLSEIDDLHAYSHLAIPSDVGLGTGGMESKFKAAAIASAAGIDMWIANGRDEYSIYRAMSGETGTYFKPVFEPVSSVQA